MKAITVFIFLIGLSAFTVSGDDKGKIVTVKEFVAEMDSTGLVFTMPSGYEATYVKENGDLWYGFAIKNKTADFEVRYTVWPLQDAFAEYERCKADTNCFMVNPNNFYSGRIQANVLNMTGGADADIGEFPKAAVMKEFNADAGGSSFFQFQCEFGTGYKYGQMVYLHKDNVADVIITYMSNDKSTHSELMDTPFHALKFK